MYMVLLSGWAWGRTTHWMAMILAWRTAAGRGEHALKVTWRVQTLQADKRTRWDHLPGVKLSVGGATASLRMSHLATRGVRLRPPLLRKLSSEDKRGGSGEGAEQVVGLSSQGETGFRGGPSADWRCHLPRHLRVLTSGVAAQHRRSRDGRNPNSLLQRH